MGTTKGDKLYHAGSDIAFVVDIKTTEKADDDSESEDEKPEDDTEETDGDSDDDSEDRPGNRMIEDMPHHPSQEDNERDPRRMDEDGSEGGNDMDEVDDGSNQSADPTPPWEQSDEEEDAPHTDNIDDGPTLHTETSDTDDDEDPTARVTVQGIEDTTTVLPGDPAHTRSIDAPPLDSSDLEYDNWEEKMVRRRS